MMQPPHAFMNHAGPHHQPYPLQQFEDSESEDEEEDIFESEEEEEDDEHEHGV